MVGRRLRKSREGCVNAGREEPLARAVASKPSVGLANSFASTPIRAPGPFEHGRSSREEQSDPSDEMPYLSEEMPYSSDEMPYLSDEMSYDGDDRWSEDEWTSEESAQYLFEHESELFSASGDETEEGESLSECPGGSEESIDESDPGEYQEHFRWNEDVLQYWERALGELSQGYAPGDASDTGYSFHDSDAFEDSSEYWRYLEAIREPSHNDPSFSYWDASAQRGAYLAGPAAGQREPRDNGTASADVFYDVSDLAAQDSDVEILDRRPAEERDIEVIQSSRGLANRTPGHRDANGVMGGYFSLANNAVDVFRMSMGLTDPYMAQRILMRLRIFSRMPSDNRPSTAGSERAEYIYSFIKSPEVDALCGYLDKYLQLRDRKCAHTGEVREKLLSKAVIEKTVRCLKRIKYKKRIDPSLKELAGLGTWLTRQEVVRLKGEAADYLSRTRAGSTAITNVLICVYDLVYSQGEGGTRGYRLAKYKGLTRPAAEMCNICMDCYAKDSPCLALPCSHFFHTGCIREWFNMSTSCPVCRVDLLEKT